MSSPAALAASCAVKRRRLLPWPYPRPVPSADDVAEYGRRWAEGPPEAIPGVDLRLDAQLALLDDLAPLYAEADFPEHQVEGRRYWYDNHSYGHGDGLCST